MVKNGGGQFVPLAELVGEGTEGGEQMAEEVEKGIRNVAATDFLNPSEAKRLSLSITGFAKSPSWSSRENSSQETPRPGGMPTIFRSE